MFCFANFSQQLEEAWSSILSGSVTLGGRIIGAMVILVVGKLIVNWLNRLFASLLAKQRVEPSVQTFLKSTVNVLLLVMLGLAIIGKLGIEIAGFAALLASAGVAIGMSLSGNLQNFAGGLVILIFRPYKVGDFIEAQGYSGTVQDIHLTNTRIFTSDNKVVYLPNGALANGNIVNYSENDLRRVDLTFSVSYNTDFEKAKAIINEIFATHELTIKDKPATVRVSAHSASSIDIAAKVWVKRADYWTVYFDVLESVKREFDNNGIEIPFNQLDVHVKNG